MPKARAKAEATCGKQKGLSLGPQANLGEGARAGQSLGKAHARKSQKKEPEEDQKKHEHRSRHHSKGLKSVPETEEEVEGAGGSKGSQDKPGEGKETKEEEEECAEPPPVKPEEHPLQQPEEGLLVSEAQENTMPAEEVDYNPDDMDAGEGAGPSTQDISKPGEGHSCDYSRPA